MANIVILSGRLGKDPEVRSLENGKKVATVTMATSKKYRNKEGEQIQETQWHNLVFWGKISETIETYTRKGSQLLVKGELTYRTYEDKEGVRKYITEIVVREFEFIGKSSGEG